MGRGSKLVSHPLCPVCTPFASSAQLLPCVTTYVTSLLHNYRPGWPRWARIRYLGPNSTQSSSPFVGSTQPLPILWEEHTDIPIWERQAFKEVKIQKPFCAWSTDLPEALLICWSKKKRLRKWVVYAKRSFLLNSEITATSCGALKLTFSH